MSKIVWGSKFSFLTRSRPLDFNFLKIFVFEKPHSLFKLIFKAIQLQKIPEHDIFQKIIFFTWASSMTFGLNTVPVAARQYLWRVLLFCTKNWSFLGLQCIFKQVKTEKKIFRQSWTKHLETFSLFSTISLHYKWNGTILLSPESECMSCLMSCRTT